MVDMNRKVILTDVDGVLLDWEYSFTSWMSRHGFGDHLQETYDMAKSYGRTQEEILALIRLFNESAMIYNLPPLRDAIRYVKKLHEDHGFIFHAITSLTTNYGAQYLRTKNLKNLFGETVFEKFVFLDTGAPKYEALKPYVDTGCVWIEDKPENALAGARQGLDALIMHHGFNALDVYPFKEGDKEDLTQNVSRIYNWKEVYHHIIGY